MNENSTQTISPNYSTTPASGEQTGPQKATLDFIRQFARIYTPLGAMPGIVLN